MFPKIKKHRLNTANGYKRARHGTTWISQCWVKYGALIGQCYFCIAVRDIINTGCGLVSTLSVKQPYSLVRDQSPQQKLNICTANTNWSLENSEAQWDFSGLWLALHVYNVNRKMPFVHCLTFCWQHTMENNSLKLLWECKWHEWWLHLANCVWTCRVNSAVDCLQRGQTGYVKSSKAPDTLTAQYMGQ